MDKILTRTIDMIYGLMARNGATKEELDQFINLMNKYVFSLF